jgi:hypothetical protein
MTMISTLVKISILKMLLQTSSSRDAMAFHVTNRRITSISSRSFPSHPTISSRVYQPLSMAEEDKEPVFISSVLKKEIVYDDKTGRFFETGYGEGDCVPDEEFCMTDSDSGDQIRLTVEEKERIFLDALQVRYSLMKDRKA